MIMKKLFLLLFVCSTLASGAQSIMDLQKQVAAGDDKAMINLALRYESGYGIEVDSAKALDLIRLAVEKGNADAMAKLSYYYVNYSGFSQKRDSAEIYRLAKEAANRGSAYGLYRFSRCFKYGFGTPKNLDSCRYYLQKAMEAGSSEACVDVAHSYLYGSVLYPHDVTKVLPISDKIEESFYGYPQSVILFDYYIQSGDETKAWKYLQKGVSNRNFYARRLHAIYLGRDICVKKNTAAAIDSIRLLQDIYKTPFLWMDEAITRLNSDDPKIKDTALIMQLMNKCLEMDPSVADVYDIVGRSYYWGNFTEKDRDKALLWWRNGLKYDCDECMVNLANYYSMNDNQDSAIYYYEMAYKLENATAAALLASQKQSEDTNALLAGLIEAADWGNENARLSAGDIYAYMLNQKDKAIACYDKAIANFFFDGYYNKSQLLNQNNDKSWLKVLKEGVKKKSDICNSALAGCYESGYGVKQSYKKAAEYYEKSSLFVSKTYLARLYLYGVVGDTNSVADRQKMLNLLYSSAANDETTALNTLAHCYKDGFRFEVRPDSAFYYFCRSAEAGNAEGMLYKGGCYLDGNGVECDTAEAMEAFLKAGEAGSSLGYYFLADCYLNGSYSVDSVKAFEYYKKGAEIEENNSLAMCSLAECYMSGIGTETDSAKALSCLYKAYEAGSPKAAGLLGDMHNYSRACVNATADSAIYYYAEGAKANDVYSCYILGDYLMKYGNKENALNLLLTAAKGGSQDAYLMLVRAVLNGDGTESNPEAAYQMLKSVVHVWQNADAYMLYGLMYDFGIGVEKDSILGFAYTDTAVRLGSPNAMQNMAINYLNGNVVECDTTKALELLEKAAEVGESAYAYRLAKFYLSLPETSYPNATKRAFELFNSAAERGNLDAKCAMGLCYEEGNGVQISFKKAYELYKEAADAGSAYGMYLLGMCYLDGIYVDPDNAQAAQYILKAAENGNLYSCFIIGKMYAYGQGVPKDKKKAKHWLTIAYENGIEEAGEWLSQL